MEKTKPEPDRVVWEAHWMFSGRPAPHAVLALGVPRPPHFRRGHRKASLDRVPADVKANTPVSLQRGAQVYVNYCLGCHSLAYMRFNRLQDLGLSEQQIRDNLIPTEAKVGDLMKIAAEPKSVKEWFGAAPPDLSVIARSRASGDGSGADWLYSYLRGFYRDPSRPTGWNNTVFANVGMPHVLLPASGRDRSSRPKRWNAVSVQRKRRWTGTRCTGSCSRSRKADAGRLRPPGRDLVNFLVYVGEPARGTASASASTCLFPHALFVLAYALKKEFWKDVH
jgi:ubiquinol-cytochrome c reductase cytochrome c1 subunit